MEHDDGMDSADSDCILVGVTRPAFATKKRVFRSRSYVCHICPKNFEMQVSFVEHMKTEHPGSKLKCTLCIKLFVSPNGLFKHERSHEYLKYFCDYCSYMCQFPYQIKAHENTHTKTEWFGCDTCDKKFSSKAASRAHRKTHNLLIQCDLCPETNEKRYTLIQACNLHNVVCMALDGPLNVENILSGNPSFLSTLQKRTVKFASSIEQISSCSAFFFLKSLHHDFPFFRNIQVK